MLESSFIWIGVVLGILVFLVILFMILIPSEKKLKKKIEIKEDNKKKLFVNHILLLRGLKKESREVLEDINRLSRKFFEEMFGLPSKLEYLEIAEKFKDKNRKDIVNFCKRMEEALYSKKELTKIYLNTLLDDLEKLAVRESKEEQKAKFSMEIEDNKKSLEREIQNYGRLKALPNLENGLKSSLFPDRLNKPKLALLNELPTRGPNSIFLGKLPETGQNAYFFLEDLKSNLLISGSNKSGKTTFAQILAEGVLLKNRNVLVFDPKSQWSGFLKECKNAEILEKYPEFGMSPENVLSFKTLIKKITDPYEILEIEKSLGNPGEIIVFDLGSLTPPQIDVFIASAFEQIFQLDLKPDPNLKTLIVCEDVHDLLKGLGGSGAGFIQLERGLRNLSEKGIGITMTSQFSEDFVRELKARINMRVHMKTTSERDLFLIKKRFGEGYSEKVKILFPGQGLILNPDYNQGSPYLVKFRPLVHDSGSLNSSDLELYHQYLNLIEDFEYQIWQLKRLGGRVTDCEFDIRLAKDKFKSGQFELTKIYFQTLSPKILKEWGRIKRKPLHFIKPRIKKEDLLKGINFSKSERLKWKELTITPQEENLKYEKKPLSKNFIPKTPEFSKKITQKESKKKKQKGKDKKENKPADRFFDTDIDEELEDLRLRINRLAIR
ncbi:hypothetical protein K0A97_02995 [Patescibacteria group bacterium]|nr:hypothetical protein [Patescibacteria group bacterium]